MIPRDRGKIIQVGSALAFRSIPLQSAYCASKHAIQGFTESLRTELIHQKSNVGISLVNMPALNTTQFIWTKNKMPHKARPTGTIFQPEVAAEAILFAAEHDRREVMVGYTTVEATLGEKVCSGTARSLSRQGGMGRIDASRTGGSGHAGQFLEAAAPAITERTGRSTVYPAVSVFSCGQPKTDRRCWAGCWSR